MQISLIVTTFALGIFTLTRIFLLLYTGISHIPLALWPIVLGKGLFFDAATLAYLLPLALIADALIPFRIRNHRWIQRLGLLLLTFLVFGLLFLGTAEIIFWIEFHTRFNFIALDYLIYTNEVIRNIWQSYPIVWILGAIAVVSGGVAWLFSRYGPAASPRSRSRQTTLVLWVAAGILPLLSVYFVRIEMMYRQGNAFAEELSGNGLFTLAAAVRNNELDYDRFYATIPQDKATQILHRLGVEWTDDLYRREYDRWGDDARHDRLPVFLLRRPRHVVLISVESLSASFVGAYGSAEHLTPRLDQLAANGLMFTHVFATGTRTVRGLEALSLATPPIPGQAIIRRPKNAHLASLGEMLSRQNFSVFFLYGGYGYFDNMNAFFAANNYTVRDRSSIANDTISYENVWGVADEDLFNNAIRILDQAATEKKPFFAHIMTTSNHRPYTYPNGRIDIPSPGGRSGAVKYSDFAIGQFIDHARSKPWFRDTLFVIVADHCASVAGKTQLPVAQYRIPLIFYGPELVKTGRIDRMISQMDIPPTLLDCLGMAGDDNFFGEEAMDQHAPPRAFISNYQNLGYYKENQLVILKPKRRIEGYRVDPITFESTPMTPNPVLVEEAIAYYQTASRAFKRGIYELLWK